MTQNTDTKAQPNRIMRFKTKLLQKVAEGLFGRELYFTSLPISQVPAVAVFWYLEGGMRKFIMLRQVDGKGNVTSPAMFCNTTGAEADRAVNEHLREAVKTYFGEAFYRSLDQNLLNADRISASPSFRLDDETTGLPHLVPSLVWATQITPEQAQLAQCKIGGIDLCHIAEFSVLGADVLQSHQMVYQSISRHLHTIRGETQVLEQMEDMFHHVQTGSKVIH